MNLEVLFLLFLLLFWCGGGGVFVIAGVWCLCPHNNNGSNARNIYVGGCIYWCVKCSSSTATRCAFVSVSLTVMHFCLHKQTHTHTGVSCHVLFVSSVLECKVMITDVVIVYPQRDFVLRLGHYYAMSLIITLLTSIKRKIYLFLLL